MTYRVSYHVSLKTAPEDEREPDATETEEFSTEYEAFRRARDLLEDGDHGAVSVRDSRTLTAGARHTVRCQSNKRHLGSSN
jgi:hypothetical protein